MVKLNPPGYSNCWAYGVSGTAVVGSVGNGSDFYAAIWPKGTAASFVNLNPAGYEESEAAAVSGLAAAGTVYSGVKSFAGVWPEGTARSFVNLNPAGFTSSGATGISGASVSGWVSNSEGYHAAIWPAGTAAGFVNLNPSGFPNSDAYGISGDMVVGDAVDHDGNTYAALWLGGTAATFIDLASTLPKGWENSFANAVSTTTGAITVAGTAYDQDGLSHAVLWIVPTAGLSSVTCAPEVLAGGQTTHCTVTLSGPAGPKGAPVLLEGFGPITVPASVTVPAGASYAVFSVLTKPASSETACTVKATLWGVAKTTNFTVGPASPSIASASVTGTTLTLTGWFGLAGVTTSVDVGGAVVTKVNVAPTKITCPLPSTVSGPVKISVIMKTSTGSTLYSKQFDLTIVTGRWDAIWTTNGPDINIGDNGILVTSQTQTSAPVTGTVVAPGSISGANFSFQTGGSSSGAPVVKVKVAVGDGVMTGTVTNTSDNSSIPVTFRRESDVPVTPYTGAPKVASVSVVAGSGSNAFKLLVTWNRPMNGWEFYIKQKGNGRCVGRQRESGRDYL